MKIYLILEDAFGEGYYHRGVKKTKKEAEDLVEILHKEDHFRREYEIGEVEL